MPSPDLGTQRSGQVVVLNGVPRSGKTSIAHAMQESSDEQWLNLGVDTAAGWLPDRLRPGIGLRPGGERPDLEDAVVLLYRGLFARWRPRDGASTWWLTSACTSDTPDRFPSSARAPIA